MSQSVSQIFRMHSRLCSQMFIVTKPKTLVLSAASSWEHYDLMELWMLVVSIDIEIITKDKHVGWPLFLRIWEATMYVHEIVLFTYTEPYCFSCSVHFAATDFCICQRLWLSLKHRVKVFAESKSEEKTRFLLWWLNTNRACGDQHILKQHFYWWVMVTSSMV